MRIRPGTGAPRGSTARRLATAVALASVGLATAASAALAAPTTTVTPATDLDPAGHEVTVDGTGFSPPTVIDGLGVYVAQTAEVGGRIVADASGARWIRSFDGGAFEARIVVKRRMSVRGTDVDCLVDRCAVSTWTAHTNPETSASLFTSEPISFGVRPQISVTPQSSLARNATTTVTVTGSGFDPLYHADGLYVALSGVTEEWWRLSGRDFGTVKWVSPGATPGETRDVLNADGTFTTTLDISPRFTTGEGNSFDCLVTECAVVTLAAHGSTLRGFDTLTTLNFAVDVAVSKTTGLDPLQPNALTVAGSGFRPGMPGVYAGLTAIVDGRVLTGPAKWLRPGAPTPDQTLTDGAFATSLTVSRTFRSGGTTVDCAATPCAISTWRGHTLPTPAALISSTPLTFAAIPAPPPPAPPTPQPEPAPDDPVLPRQPVTAGAVKAPKKAQRVGKARTARVGVITCRASKRCRVSAPKRVRVKIGKRTFRARVLAPRAVKPGKRAWVRIKLPKRAAQALTGRRAVVKVKVAVRADGANRVVRTVRVTLAKPKAGKAKRRAAPAQA